MANVVWEPGISRFAAAILDPREERKIKLLYARWENIYGVRIGFHLEDGGQSGLERGA